MKRKILSQLIAWKLSPNRKPLVIHGARQVGKTWALKRFGLENFSKCHYFNFEKRPELADSFDRDLDPKRIIQSLSFAAKVPISPDDLIIFDEVQLCSKALTSLKYFCEEFPLQPVCAAGSLLGLHYGETDAYPVGKTTSLDMFPMDFEEFCWAMENIPASSFLQEVSGTDPLGALSQIDALMHAHFWALFQEYLITGGLPEVVDIYRIFRAGAHSAGVKVRARQRELIDDYTADMAKHAGKVNALHIERVFRAIPAQLSREMHRFQFKNVIPGKTSYAQLAAPIDWLTATGLVLKSNITNQAQIPLNAYTKENMFTLFVFDVGILGALSEIPPESILSYDYGWFKGSFAENAVAQALHAAGFGSLYSWNEGTSEIEFVKEIAGRIIPIEVKAGINTKAKSLNVFRAKYNPMLSVLISALPPPAQQKQGLLHIPLYLAGNLLQILHNL